MMIEDEYTGEQEFSSARQSREVLSIGSSTRAMLYALPNVPRQKKTYLQGPSACQMESLQPSDSQVLPGMAMVAGNCVQLVKPFVVAGVNPPEDGQWIDGNCTNTMGGVEAADEMIRSGKEGSIRTSATC